MKEVNSGGKLVDVWEVYALSMRNPNFTFVGSHSCEADALDFVSTLFDKPETIDVSVVRRTVEETHRFVREEEE